jgi:flagellar protein FliO/FliZ
MSWFIITLLLCIAMIGGGLLLRSYMTGAPVLPGMGPKPEKRLQVLEQASVDGRRRLILIRRDNVEHLIMTGGPVDLVVETGIGATAQARPRAVLADADTLRREPVSFGRAAARTPAAAPANTAAPAAAGE